MLRPLFYILDDADQPIPCAAMKWAKWFERRENTIVQQEEVCGLWVSTVFLGLDHNYHPEGLPLLWETMIFDSGVQYGDYQRRYSSRKDAEAGHAMAVEWAKRQKTRRRPANKGMKKPGAAAETEQGDYTQ